MRYPVGKDKQDFIDRWYVSQGFGEWRPTDQIYHEGIDINLRSGGNSDLGQPIYAISPWTFTYFHIGTHPTKLFGKHYVYKITGSFGDRWVHCAHNQDVFKTGGDSGSEGDQLSTLGMSGTTAAHLHFSILKVDPSTLRSGIDTVAKTKEELNAWFEDPIPFIEKWVSPPVNYEQISEELKKELDEKKIQVGNLQGQVQGLLTQNENLSSELGTVRGEVKALTAVVESKTQAIDLLSKDDVVQLETLHRAEEKAQRYSESYFRVLRTIREQLKLSSSISDEEIAESEAYNSLQSLYQSKVREKDLSEYTFIIKIGGFIWRK